MFKAELKIKIQKETMVVDSANSVLRFRADIVSGDLGEFEGAKEISLKFPQVRITKTTIKTLKACVEDNKLVHRINIQGATQTEGRLYGFWNGIKPISLDQYEEQFLA